MSRPHYETPIDRQNEDEVSYCVAEIWNLDQVVKNDERVNRIDRTGLRNGEPVVWFEIKCRRKRFKTFFISMSKVSYGLELEKLTNLPFYIVVGWPEGVFVIRPALSGIQDVQWGGRKGEREEAVAHFDTQKFSLLSSSNLP